MGSNIADWTKEAIGTALTSEQFLNNPEIQDKVFDKIFGGYIDRFGQEGAAQAWFGGPGAVGKTGRQDQLGTSVGDYGNRFTEGLGQAKDAWEGLRDITASTRQETEALTTQYDQFGQVAQTAMNGLATALADGKLEGRELLQILMQVVQQLMSIPSLGAGGGGLGGIFSALLGGIPGFANGTRSAPGGLAVVGERGPELVNLPKGSQVIPSAQSMRMMRGGQQAMQVQVGVSVDDEGKLQAYVKKVSKQEVASAAPRIVGAANQQAPAAVARHQATKGGADWR
ncbi:hypothetical protein QM996_17945 [Sinorhizobium chiapasense]